MFLCTSWCRVYEKDVLTLHLLASTPISWGKVCDFSGTFFWTQKLFITMYAILIANSKGHEFPPVVHLQTVHCDTNSSLFLSDLYGNTDKFLFRMTLLMSALVFFIVQPLRPPRWSVLSDSNFFLIYSDLAYRSIVFMISCSGIQIVFSLADNDLWILHFAGY